MENNKKSSYGTGLSLPMLAGMYHGYMDAQGLPIEPKQIEDMLNYGPMVAGALGGGLVGLVVGAAKGIEDAHDSSTTVLYAAGGGVLGAGAGAVAVGVLSGLATLLGYGAGYVTGSIMK